MLSLFNYVKLKRKKKLELELKQKLINYVVCYNCLDSISDRVYVLYQIQHKSNSEPIICCSITCKKNTLQKLGIQNNDFVIKRRHKFYCHQCISPYYIHEGLTRLIHGKYYNVCNKTCLIKLQKRIDIIQNLKYN